MYLHAETGFSACSCPSVNERTLATRSVSVAAKPSADASVYLLNINAIAILAAAAPWHKRSKSQSAHEALLNSGYRIIGQRCSDRHHRFKRSRLGTAAARLALVTPHVCLALTSNQRQSFCKSSWQGCYIDISGVRSTSPAEQATHMSES